MKQFISVIIPLYNCEEYILRCLDSLYFQDDNDYEIIIINDGSTDKSGIMCKEFIKNNDVDKKITYIEKENGGVSSARNLGIDKAKSEWIAFVDADDFVTSDFISSLKKMVVNHSKCDFVILNNYDFYEGKIIENSFISPKENEVKTVMLNTLSENYSNKFEKNYMKCCRTVWGKLYKKSIIDLNHIKFDENIKIYEDGLFNISYLKKCNHILFSDQSIYYYVLSNSSSATNKFYPNRLKDDKYKIEKLNSLLKEFEDDSDIMISKQIFLYNTFSSYLKKYLYHPKQNQYNRIANLKDILQHEVYGNFFDVDISPYLSKKKRLIYKLLKKKRYFLVDIILKMFFSR